MSLSKPMSLLKALLSFSSSIFEVSNHKMLTVTAQIGVTQIMSSPRQV